MAAETNNGNYNYLSGGSPVSDLSISYNSTTDSVIVTYLKGQDGCVNNNG